MIRGKTREAPLTQQMIVPNYDPPTIEASIHNRFDIEVIDTKTGAVRQKAYAENIILNQLWTTYMGNYGWFAYIQYGIGTGTIAATRTQLFSFLGALNCNSYSSMDASSFDSVTGVATYKRAIQLSETTAVGQTLTEVGIGKDAQQTSLLTHAMLKDMNGNQISITKTDTDIINIYATVFVHFNPAGYSNGSVKIVSGTYSSKASSSTNLPDLICVLEGKVRFPDNYNTYASVAFEYGKGNGFDYNPGTSSIVDLTSIGANKQVKGIMRRLAAGSGNDRGGYGQLICMGIAFRIQSDGWYTGSNIIGEAVATGDGVKTGFNLKFPWAENVTIYVNGVAQSSGVTVRNLPNHKDATSLFGSEMNAIDASGNFILAPKPTGNLYGSDYWGGGGSAYGGGAGLLYYENPHYATVGIKKVYTPYGGDIIWASTDLVTWVQITTGASGEIAVPAQYQNYRYWKSVLGYASFNCPGMNVVEMSRPYDVTFDAPPASGAVITADYTTRTIAKDINHVFDFTFILQLGEKTT